MCQSLTVENECFSLGERVVDVEVASGHTGV